MTTERPKIENKVRLNNVRLAFPTLFKAEQVNGEGDPRFSASFLLPKDHPAIKELEAVFVRVAKAKWGDKAAEQLAAIKKKDRTCLHDGDDKSKFDGFKGNMYISAGSKVRPAVFDRDRSTLVEADGRPYSGCYVNATIEIWAQDNKHGQRLNAQLTGVQFYKDGDAFAGGSVASADDFEDLSVESEDDLAG